MAAIDADVPTPMWGPAKLFPAMFPFFVFELLEVTAGNHGRAKALEAQLLKAQHRLNVLWFPFAITIWPAKYFPLGGYTRYLVDLPWVSAHTLCHVHMHMTASFFGRMVFCSVVPRTTRSVTPLGWVS